MLHAVHDFGVVVAASLAHDYLLDFAVVDLDSCVPVKQRKNLAI